MNGFFDAHCHLQDAQFAGEQDAVIAESRAAGVTHFIVPATDFASFASTLALSRSQDAVYCALGIHPHSATEWSGEVAARIRNEILSNEKVVAIGEIGLDYHYDFSPRDVQRQAFSEQIVLAMELGKPIVIHTRESEEDVFRIVEEHYAAAAPELPRGQFHCFSASIAWMQRAIELGFYVSFTGNITFKNSGLCDVVRETPLERMLIETDSPYLAPAPYRGKRNTPAMLPFIAQKAAELKHLDLSTVMHRTFANTLSLFRIVPASLPRTIVPLLFVLGLTLSAPAVFAQQPSQPAGIAPPDSILTGERRKAEELRKKQQEEIEREAEQHRQDSIKTAAQALEDAKTRAREQARQDSLRIVQERTEAERHAAYLLTPEPWRAIGAGGNLGIVSFHTGVSKQQLTNTSVLGYGFQIKSALTRRLDVVASFTESAISDNFPEDSVYNYGSNGAGGFPYNPTKDFKPGVTRLVQSESLTASVFGIDIDYVITRPTSVVRFYFGVGYQHYLMRSLQNYLLMKDSITALPSNSNPAQYAFTQYWSRNGIDVLFGAKTEVELNQTLTLEPYAEISATGLFNGPTQLPNFVFQPDPTDLIAVNVRLGVTLYYGWWGVARQQ